MKKLLLLLALLSANAFYAQENGIPYRLGDKFGVANAKGKMLIPARFDIVQPKIYNKNRYVNAYTFTDNGTLSTFIYNNKIVLDNKNYNDYFVLNGLVLATEYKVLRNSNTFSEKNFSETNHLYDLEGKDVFTADYKAIDMHYDIDDTGKLPVFLIYTLDLNGNRSLYLYDKKAKKVTKTFIENAKTYLADIAHDYQGKNKKVNILYRDNTGKNKKMVLKIENNTIVVESDTIVQNVEQDTSENMPYGVGDIGPGDYSRMTTEPAANTAEETFILSARKVELKKRFYYLPEKIEEIIFTTHKLNANYSYIVSKNNKQGLYNVTLKRFVVPIAYDEIIFADFGPTNNGVILRNGDKYGLCIYESSHERIIEPVFDKVPVLADYDYLGKSKPLIKLYDKDGKLFCYTDETGKLFYKP